MATENPFDILSSGADFLGSLFGSSTSTSGTQSGTSTVTGSRRQTEQLEIDQAAIQKIIEDVLGGPEGLATIFAGEQNAGIFDSSVAAQASGDIAAKLVGELAKLTSKRVVEAEEDTTTKFTAQSQSKEKSGGLLSSIGDFFGV